MSEAKFTKGEWKVTKVQERLFRVDSECGEVAKTIRWNGSESHKYNNEVEANAHLIAAAPEMYNLLKECKEVLGGTYDVNDWPANGETCCDYMMRDIEKLLAKARGEL